MGPLHEQQPGRVGAFQPAEKAIPFGDLQGLCIRARLQSCRNRPEINEGFSLRGNAKPGRDSIRSNEMKQGFSIALVVAGCLMAASWLPAQAAPGQNTPPATPPKPAESNPFPEDTSTVPLMPSKGTPALPEGTYSGEENGTDNRHIALPSDDLDPVRSPDDPVPETDSAEELHSSSSRAGLDKILPEPDDDDQPQGKKRKLTVNAPEHKETSAEDIQVGDYYLDTKNWKAALSRFESAMVLAPDEPEVYWGLAESARHLGNFAEARDYYKKVAEYDPDSKHGKQAIKALKDPEIANAKAAPPAQPAK